MCQILFCKANQGITNHKLFAVIKNEKMNLEEHINCFCKKNLSFSLHTTSK